MKMNFFNNDLKHGTKKNFESPDRNWTHGLPDTGWELYLVEHGFHSRQGPRIFLSHASVIVEKIHLH